MIVSRGHEYLPELAAAAVLDALRTSQRGYPHIICSHRLFVVVPVPSPVRMRGVDNLQLTVPKARFPEDRPEWFRIMVPAGQAFPVSTIADRYMNSATWINPTFVDSLRAFIGVHVTCDYNIHMSGM